MNRIQRLHRQITLAAALLGLVALHPAHAEPGGITLRKVTVADGRQVELVFDRAIVPAQIKTEYINDIIQLSLQDVSVYPAKIFSVTGPDLSKVFAYQYAPKLVRTRLTVKGKAEVYKDRVNLQFNGPIVTVRVDGKSGAPVAQPIKKAPVAAPPAAVAQAVPGKISDEEKVLLEKVLQGSGSTATAEKEVSSSKEKKQEKPIRVSQAAVAPPGKLATGKGGPGPWRALGVMGGLLALIGLFVIGIRKLKTLSEQKGAGGGKFTKLIRSSLGSLSKGKVIETVATHYLGPKKSISVVKVCGRILVLGVSNDSINLIAQFGADGSASVNNEAYEDLDLDSFLSGGASGGGPELALGGQARNGAGAMSAGKAVFSEMLGQKSASPGPSSAQSGVRAQIRSKIEGFKQL